MARGIFTLSKVKTKKIKNEWEDPNNVWIFPDGGGPEFKFIDGTVTPAPAATPLGQTFERVSTDSSYRYTFNLGGKLRGIYATDDLIFLAVRSDTNSILIYKREFLFTWGGVTPTISTDPDDYPPGGLRKISFTGAASDTNWGTYLTVDDVNEKICVSSSTGAQLWNYDGTGYVNIDKPATTEGSNMDNTVGGIMSDYGKFCACGNGKVVIGNPWEARTYSSTTWYQSGAVYVYNLDGTGEFKIQPSPAILARSNTWSGAQLRFGTSVAIDSNRIIVGTPGLRPYDTYYNQSSLQWNGGFYTYKLDGTGETEHYGQDNLSGSYGNVETFGNFTGHWLAAKHGKIITGSENDDQADSPNSGIAYFIDTPNQSASGTSTSMSSRFSNSPRDDSQFGLKTNVGKTVLSNGTTVVMYMTMAPERNRIYYHTGGYITDYVSHSLGWATVADREPPFDLSNSHILIGSDRDSGPSTGYAYNIATGSSQMMVYTPLL